MLAAMEREGRVADSALRTIGIVSVLAILALRFYAAAWTIPMRTPWDDSTIRLAAKQQSRRETGASAVARLLLPNPPSLLQGRLNGYQRWLVIGHKLGTRIRPGSGELAFHVVNFVLLCLQALTLGLFAWWAIRDLAISAGFTFLWVSAPVVFGMNRWVLTENLVLTAGPILSFLAAWLLARETPGAKPRSRKARVLLTAGAVAYVIGLFSVAREYSTPSYVLIVGSTVLGLALAGRRWEAAVFASVTACFLAPLASPLAKALRATVTKGGREEWFHPLHEWLPHVSLYTVGPALTVALVVLVVAVVYRSVARDARSPNEAGTDTLSGRVRRELTGLRGLYWAHVILLAFYLVGVLWTRSRVSRLAILPMIVATGLALIGIRLFPEVRATLTTARAKSALLALVALSWSVLSYQLLVAFDGGKTYAHAAYRLEYYNYPLHLRPLRDAMDSYVCFEPCPYD
jgi:hypothetical protein